MIQSVNQTQLVLFASEELKDKMTMPDWAHFVKTGSNRETLPKNPDWWHIRAASILRIISQKGPVGVGKLRTRYGGRKNRGYAPDKFQQAGGKVIRSILQQLEQAELIKQEKVSNYKGRVITAKGIALLSAAAKKVGTQ